ncbi:ABC transporter ATP-binding protein [Clostridia bacterium]|nr:ABC transporter ATP-binding protein [Clostridia bacterium]
METIIRLENVEKSFKGNLLFSNVNIEIEKGSVVGFKGGNGKGKSVFFKIIAGLYKPDTGNVFVRGEQLGEKIDFPQNFGILVDKPGFVEIFSGFENLRLLADIQRKIGQKEISDIMTYLGLDPIEKKKVKSYSLGMKQKLGIAQAVMENQDIVILDEPFNALDADSNVKLYDLIRKLKSENRTVLLTSHNQSDLDELCDLQYSVPEFKVA